MIYILLIIVLVACQPATESMAEMKPRTYLALGDSYTIGESVEVNERWPVQLASRLNQDTQVLQEPLIIATTGWTTGELQDGIARRALGDTTFSYVSLLIGVNNQYRGYDIEIFRTEFDELLGQAIQFAGGDKESVFVVSIPDWGVTPFAVNRGADSQKVAQEIDAYNAIKREICERQGIEYFDITDISREAKTNLDLIAEDGLHPSGEMYTRWVDRIEPWLAEKIRTNQGTK